MSAEPMSCHPLDASVKIFGSVNQPSITERTLMEEQGSREIFTSVDTSQFLDKAPLLEYHLCRYEDCHSSKKAAPPESPLDPVKTRAIYILLILLAIWTISYIVLEVLKLV